MELGRLFFRLIEQEDGTWACRHGLQELDRHHDRADAVAHITEVAEEHRPSRIYLHDLDGRVIRLATLD